MTPSLARQWALETGLLLIRGMVAIVFLFHGSQKLFGWFDGPGISGFADALAGLGIPQPTPAAVLSACTEFFGGLFLLVGWGVRIAVIPMVINMLVAAFGVHGQAFSLQHGGMEYALTLAVVLAGLGLTGPGCWSLAGLLRAWRRRPSPRAAAARAGG